MKTKSYCPSCHAVLEFDRAVYSVVTCPKCKYKGNVEEFEESVETGDPGSFQAFKPGKLELVETDAEWLQDEKTVDLIRGKNILGRKSPNSTGNLQLPTTDSYMSRNHASIDVIMKTSGIFEHYLSDLGSQNGTFHNGDRIEKGDIIRLVTGDMIRIGHTSFKFISG